jgi:hypothetical protein
MDPGPGHESSGPWPLTCLLIGRTFRVVYQ